jgi:hypothetical protein
MKALLVPAAAELFVAAVLGWISLEHPQNLALPEDTAR